MRWGCPQFALFLGIVLAVWLGPSVFGGKVFLPVDLLWQSPPITPPPGVEGVHNSLVGDMIYENYLWKLHQRQAIAQGELPLWNPYTFCGHPVYTTGQTSAFYPFNVIFLILPLANAYVVSTWLHLWAGGLFQYLFLRRLGVRGFGAAVGGLIFALCGFFALRLVWPMLLASAIWLPLMLICIMWLAESRTVRQAAGRVAVGAVVFALPLLGGFLEIAFYAYMVAALFTLACCWRLWWSGPSVGRCLGTCAQALCVAGVAVLLAAPQLLPFLEVKDLNIRAEDMEYDEIVERALRTEHLLPVVIPDIFGNPARHRTWDLQERRTVPIEARFGRDYYAYGTKNYSENGYYLGCLALLLAVLSLGARGRPAESATASSSGTEVNPGAPGRPAEQTMPHPARSEPNLRTERPPRVFLWLLLVLSLCLAFGTPIYKVFFHTVPGFGQVRTPFRWMFPATFAVASLAAIGAAWWRDRLETPTSRGGRVMAVAILTVPAALVLATMGLLVHPDPAHRMAERALEAIPRLSEGISFRTAWDLAGFMWLNLLRFSVFLLLAVAIITLAWLGSWTPRRACVLASGCLVLLAVELGWPTYRFNTHADPAWLARTAPEIEFLREDEDFFRIARFGPEMLLHPNLPQLYGLDDVGGYDSIILSDYAAFLEVIETPRRLYYNQVTGFNRLRSLDSPLVSLLNVRYLLTTRFLEHDDWELAFEDGIRVYRNRREHPRAFLVHHAEAVDSLDAALKRLADGLDPRVSAVVEGAPEAIAALPQVATASTGQARIVAYRNSTVTIEVTSPSAALLVLADVMYPGWEVYINGAKADILKVNGIFRGTCVPAGRHEVSFRFEPARLRWGTIMAAGALGLVIGGSVLSWTGRRASESPRRRGPEPTNG